jgi:hypothetical protein
MKTKDSKSSLWPRGTNNNVASDAISQANAKKWGITDPANDGPEVAVICFFLAFPEGSFRFVVGQPGEIFNHDDDR